MYEGYEHFTVNSNNIDITMSDFWKWAYSDLTSNINRSVLAEYIVASALKTIGMDTEKVRVTWRPYDLLTKDGYKVEVKSAARVQSWDTKHPDKINFRIAPARLPDETGDYKLDAPQQRNSDVYIFCIYRAVSRQESPLDLDLWDFYVLSTKVLDKKKPTQKSISLPVLLQLDPVKCQYHEIGDAIKTAMTLAAD